MRQLLAILLWSRPLVHNLPLRVTHIQLCSFALLKSDTKIQDGGKRYAKLTDFVFVFVFVFVCFVCLFVGVFVCLFLCLFVFCLFVLFVCFVVVVVFFILNAIYP